MDKELKMLKMYLEKMKDNTEFSYERFKDFFGEYEDVSYSLGYYEGCISSYDDILSFVNAMIERKEKENG